MTMRPVPMSARALAGLVLGLAVPLTAQQGPCEQITAACKDAGFTLGGASTGTGLELDCVIPIIQVVRQPSAATRPLPHVDPQVVAACRANHPTFGQLKGPTPTADVKSAPRSSAKGFATGASSAATGVGVASGTGITPNSSVTGASSVKPGIASNGLEDPKFVKPSALTCLIGPEDEGSDLVTLTGSTASVSISSSNGPVSKGLASDECAFKDRALRYPQEPSYLCLDASIRSVGFDPSRMGTGKKGLPTGSGTKGQEGSDKGPATEATSYPVILADGLRFSGSGAEVLAHALNGPNQFYTFMVHSGHVGGRFCWIVDKFAEGKSPPA
jgi:hypothetical protein